MEPAQSNPYAAPKGLSRNKGEPKRQLWRTRVTATASFTLFVFTAAMVLVVGWALAQYPAMGIRLDTPSRPFLEMLIGLSCSLGSLTAIGALFLACVAWNGS